MKNLFYLQNITAPFAYTSEHVQGPGGNASFKQDGKLTIKASGFTFKDVAENTGFVVLNNQLVIDNLLAKVDLEEDVVENAPPVTLDSVPAGLKPSMEFEFHSLLETFVLHTHSVYVNVVTCATECEFILSGLFKTNDYLLVPYVTPGFPIARELVRNNKKQWPSIIFLKNHGIIIHGNNSEEVILKYKYVNQKIREHLGLASMPDLIVQEVQEGVFEIPVGNIFGGNADINRVEEDLVEKILIPDQSIFFRNKLSSDKSAKREVYLDKQRGQVIISGSEKFANAARAMLQSVFYIRQNIRRLHLTPDYITTNKLEILHGLTTEKYRLGILKS